MRFALLLLACATFVVAGCGTGAARHAAEPESLSAYGMSIRLPPTWCARIVLGAEGRPVLHAGSFELPANDDDSGEIAQESMGQDVYLNIRALGPGRAGNAVPVSFSSEDFSPPAPRTLPSVYSAARDVTVSGERYRISAVWGGSKASLARALDEANSVLATVKLVPYAPATPPQLAKGNEEIRGYGITMRLPHMGRGKLEAGSSQIRLRLEEHGPGDEGPWFTTGRPPIQLSDAEFVPGPTAGTDTTVATTAHSFVDRGRQFVLWVDAKSLPPDPAAVKQANEALGTLTVEPGDFYPGTVEPATFVAASGWHSGTSGRTDVQPDGQSAATWTSTIPYRDQPFEFPPSKTIAALPPDGIIIDVQLFGPGGYGGGKATPPFRIAQSTGESGFEGVPEGVGVYQIGGHVPRQHYDVNINVLFGRKPPTRAQVAAADAQLARLNLPDWASSE